MIQHKRYAILDLASTYAGSKEKCVDYSHQHSLDLLIMEHI